MNWIERFRWAEIKQYQVWVVVLLSVGVTFSETIGMAMLLPVFEFVDHGRDVSVLVENSRRWELIAGFYEKFNLPLTLMGLMLPVIGLILIRQSAMYAKQIYCAMLQYEILQRIQQRVFASFMNADYSFSRDRSAGQLLNLMMTDGLRAATAAQFLFQLIAVQVLVVGYVVLFWFMHGWTALIAAGVLLGVSFTVRSYITKSRRYGKAVSGLNETLQKRIVELFNGIRLVKLSDRGASASDQVGVLLDGLRDQSMMLVRMGGRMRLLFEPAAMLILLVMLFFAIEMMDMSLAGVSMLGIIIIRMVPLARAVLDTRQAVYGYLPSFENVYTMIEQAESDNQIKSGSKPFKALEKDLIFEDVSYQYGNSENNALQSVNLRIPANKMTALVGHSGAGKSTLVDLIPRLIAPSAGKVLADGVDLSELKLSDLRQQVAFVSQEGVLFDDTVENNIRFACPHSSSEEVIEAAKLAYADGFIQQLAEGYQTPLGDRGARLSVGQRQRISLARALLQKASILILDEPTSALDSETEQGIQSSLEQLRAAGKTTLIVIAHRMATIYKADQIVVLDQGRMVECGTHQELMHQDEWYAKVLNMQSPLESQLSGKD